MTVTTTALVGASFLGAPDASVTTDCSSERVCVGCLATVVDPLQQRWNCRRPHYRIVVPAFPSRTPLGAR